MSDIPAEAILRAQALTAEQIEALSPAEREEYNDLQRRVVFGHNSQVDNAGTPIEEGIGSAKQPSRNSIEAFRRWCGPKSDNPDPNFEENLKNMEAAYSAHVAARKAAKAQRAGRTT